MDESSIRAVLDDLGLDEKRTKYVEQILKGEKLPGKIFLLFSLTFFGFDFFEYFFDWKFLNNEFSLQADWAEGSHQNR